MSNKPKYIAGFDDYKEDTEGKSTVYILATEGNLILSPLDSVEQSTKLFNDWMEATYNKKQNSFFKIKHKPSGLFYQVSKHMGSNLSKTGKVYSKINHVKSAYNPEKGSNFRIILAERSPLIKILEDLGYKLEKRMGYYGQQTVITPASEWEIIEI